MTIFSDIITDDIEQQLNDVDQVIWTNETLFKYVTEAQNAVILLGVDANIVTAEFILEQSATQTIPGGGVRFIDIPRNVAGGPVRKIEKKIMDEVVPGWMIETTETGIEHYMFEEEKPTAFWIYPTPSVGTLKIELSYARAVELITKVEDPITLSDIYIPAIKEYLLWRCMSMENENMAMGLATQHLQNFYTLLGKKYQGGEILKAVMNG
ncbi:MAG: hypothetical protein GY710_09070 [Desulfobacteraceae bacterium]|nr:hypothetical protein [Desulfobacteraceae bacterium]